MPLKIFQSNEQIQPQKPKHILAVAAGKGGVGKSTVAVHLALALKRIGYKVGLMDTDLYGPSIRKMLPEDRAPQQNGKMIIPAECQGIKMISMAYFRQENEAAVVRAPIANGVITQFLNQVEWGDLDYLLIDFPPGTGDIQLTVSQQANLSGAVMVTTPQEVALMDVRKAMNMFDQVQVPLLGIVENMSYFLHEKSGEVISIFGKGGGEKLAKESGIPLLAEIPIDPTLCTSADAGKQHCGEKTSEAFNLLAARVVAEIQQSEKVCVVRKVFQKDNHTMSILWSDGITQDFKYSALQKICPCAGCVDEATGKRVSDTRTVDENVSAKSITAVGRYAIKIQFTSGCSTGIYSFEMLRSSHV